MESYFPKLSPSWQGVLKDEMQKDYMSNLALFLKEEKQEGKTIFPDESNIFNALNASSFNDIKVVILGQDPYHDDGQAHGLSFSVQKGVKIPPSLRNIYKELESDLGIKPPNHGYLQSWADQGVLLLNSVLTVEAHKAGSHRNKGWEQFTDHIIRSLEAKNENLVFILWGGFAHKKGAFIDETKHLVIKTPHPSPLSSYRGFFDSKPFSQCNDYLKTHGIDEIDWKIND